MSFIESLDQERQLCQRNIFFEAETEVIRGLDFFVQFMYVILNK